MLLGDGSGSGVAEGALGEGLGELWEEAEGLAAGVPDSLCEADGCGLGLPLAGLPPTEGGGVAPGLTAPTGAAEAAGAAALGDGVDAAPTLAEGRSPCWPLPARAPPCPVTPVLPTAPLCPTGWMPGACSDELAPTDMHPVIPIPANASTTPPATRTDSARRAVRARRAVPAACAVPAVRARSALRTAITEYLSPAGPKAHRSPRAARFRCPTRRRRPRTRAAQAETQPQYACARAVPTQTAPSPASRLPTTLATASSRAPLSASRRVS